jgi:hypothetical protein
MSSSSPSASSAPSVARRPRSRCCPPGGPTSTSSIARSSPRVGRLPPSFVSSRRGRSRCDNRRRAEGGKESTCLAIDQAALQSCLGDKPPGREVRDQYRYRPRQGRLYPLLLIVVVVTATPPPIAAATTATAQELGVRAEGGIFILFFLFAWREASGYWRGHATSTFPPLSSR